MKLDYVAKHIDLIIGNKKNSSIFANDKTIESIKLDLILQIFPNIDLISETKIISPIFEKNMSTASIITRIDFSYFSKH